MLKTITKLLQNRSNLAKANYESFAIAKRALIGYQLSSDQAFVDLEKRAQKLRKGLLDNRNKISETQLRSITRSLESLRVKLNLLEDSHNMQESISAAYRSLGSSRPK